MTRVDGLIRLHARLHGIRGRPRQHVSDVLRGALVLGVGALDGLVLDAVAEGIAPTARGGQLGDNLAKWTKDDPGRVLAAFASTDPHEALAVFCREQLGDMTFQRSKAIEGVLWDVLRIAAPWDAAARALTVKRERWTATRVTNRLDDFVERRHRIAHAGDLRRDRRSAAPIQVDYMIEASRVIRAVGFAVSAAVDERIRASRRALR